MESVDRHKLIEIKIQIGKIMLELINQITTSPTTNVVLTLLLFFQWYRQYAKEQSIKNNLFSIRRMLGRTLETTDAQTLTQKAHDLIDALDATLATLDARTPFVKRIQETLNAIQVRFQKESMEELKRLPTEVDTSVRE